MEKVQLTKEQAQAMQDIERLIADPYVVDTYESVGTVIAKKALGWEFTDERKAVNELTEVQFINALVYGYEAEKTVGEKLQELHTKVIDGEFNPYCSDIDKEDYHLGMLRAFGEIAKHVDLFQLK